MSNDIDITAIILFFIIGAAAVYFRTVTIRGMMNDKLILPPGVLWNKADLDRAAYLNSLVNDKIRGYELEKINKHYDMFNHAFQHFKSTIQSLEDTAVAKYGTDATIKGVLIDIRFDPEVYTYQDGPDVYKLKCEILSSCHYLHHFVPGVLIDRRTDKQETIRELLVPDKDEIYNIPNDKYEERILKSAHIVLPEHDTKKVVLAIIDAEDGVTEVNIDGIVRESSLSIDK